MDPRSSRARLLVALGKKNEELRLRVSGTLSKSLNSVTAATTDPDYDPSDNDDDDSSDLSDSSGVSSPTIIRKAASARNRVQVLSAVKACVKKHVDSVSEKQKKLTKKKTKETQGLLNSAVSAVMDGLLECACEGKNYDFQSVNHDKGYTKRGLPRKRMKFEDTKKFRKKMKMEKVIEALNVKPPCRLACYLQCVNAIHEQRRQAINEGFRRLDPEGRRAFVMKSQRKTPKRQCTTSSVSGGKSRRENTFKYFLTDKDGLDVQVCKTFYLGTLGYDKSNDRILKTLRASINVGDVMPPLDKRGRHPNATKVDRTPIVDHIKSFNPTISHYRRSHAPNRLYLPSDITIRLMHGHFKESFPNLAEKVSYELYRQEVAKLNISFTKLGHEECFDCAAFEEHCSSNEGHSKTPLVEGCEVCKEWNDHHERYKKTRIHYQIDVDKTCSPDELIVSADLQKVIMLPRAEMFKEVIFIPRIIAFNESFVPVGCHQKKSLSSVKPLAVIWHEAISGRKKSDIASTFYTFLLKNRDKKFITIWLDNCAAQNKNWALFSLFVYVVNQCAEISLEVLEVKYFVSGHNFMSCDAFHHQIELSMSHRPKILDFNDFSEAVRASNSSRADVHEMRVEDFLEELKDYKSATKLNKLHPKPVLPEFVAVRFEKGKHYFQFKNDFSDEYQDLNYLTAKVYKQGLPQPQKRTAARGVESERKQNLINKLKAIIPKNRLTFWESLPVRRLNGVT